MTYIFNCSYNSTIGGYSSDIIDNPLSKFTWPVLIVHVACRSRFRLKGKESHNLRSFVRSEDGLAIMNYHLDFFSHYEL